MHFIRPHAGSSLSDQGVLPNLSKLFGLKMKRKGLETSIEKNYNSNLLHGIQSIEDKVKHVW